MVKASAAKRAAARRFHRRSIIGDRKELNILGSHLSPYAYPFVIENMLKGNLKTDGVVSHIFKIEEWEKAFDYATGKYGDFKVAFQFD